MNKQLIVKQQSRLKTLIFCWCKEEHYHCAMILSAPFMLQEQLQRYNKFINNTKKCNKNSNHLGIYLVNKKNFVSTNCKTANVLLKEENGTPYNF